MIVSDTIVAITTPPGRGGVGIVRLSGKMATTIATKLSKKILAPRKAIFCKIFDNQAELIDTGLVLYFQSPKSFTGEDVVEFQVHGSPIVLDSLLQACLIYGARLAKPGEFSLRAFLNDKIDLTQAEAIADLIQASSKTAAKMALKSLEGEFSTKIYELNQDIINLRIYVEAAIDFPEEEVDFLSDGKIANLLDLILDKLYELRKAAKQGLMMKEGLSIVIAGKPNAGKSTLINCLAEKDLAIVTDIPGTTRDVLRAQILLDDLPLHLIDTAGLRESEDLVEKEGIKRAWSELSKADCILQVIDINDKEYANLSREILSQVPENTPLILIFNKIDTQNISPYVEDSAVYLSLKTKEGFHLLKEKIKTVVGFQPLEGQFLARRRHLDALDRSLEFLEQGKKQLHNQRAGELLAEDLREAHSILGEITGVFTSDELLGKIFSSFCIGK